MSIKTLKISSFLISVFLIGGGLLEVGREDVGDILASGAALILACLLIGAAAPAANAVFREKNVRDEKSVAKRISLFVFGIFASVAAIFVAVGTARDFSTLASNVLLLRAPSVLVLILFLLFCGYLASKGGEVIKKFAFISMLVLGSGAILLLLLSLPQLSPGNAAPTDELRFDLSAVISRLLKVFIPVCVAVVFLACERRQDEKLAIYPRCAVAGILIGSAVLSICRLNVLLLFGKDFAQTEALPYAAAVSTISAGKLFLRMEGLSYLMYFLSTAVRATVSIGTVAAILSKLLPRRAKKSVLALITAVIVFVIASVTK